MPSPEKCDPSVPPWWQIVLGAEGLLLVIAVVSAVGPKRAGSNRSVSELVFGAPSLWHDVLIGFVVLNVVVGVIGTAFYFTAWRGRERRAADGNPEGGG